MYTARTVGAENLRRLDFRVLFVNVKPCVHEVKSLKGRWVFTTEKLYL